MAALVECRRIARHIRKALDIANERHGAFRRLERDRNAARRRRRAAQLARGVVEARHADPLLDEPLEIDVGHDQLLVGGEACRFGEQPAVFVHHPVAIPGQVGCRFAGAGRRIQIRRDAASGL